MNEFSPTQAERISARLAREVEKWMRDRSVEPHYSVESLAELLEVTERTIWNYLELYEKSAGREGIGPYVKISNKVVRIPASSVNRMLSAKTIDAPALVAVGGGK